MVSAVNASGLWKVAISDFFISFLLVSLVSQDIATLFNKGKFLYFLTLS